MIPTWPDLLGIQEMTSDTPKKGSVVVIALGGNAIIRSGDKGTIEEQRANIASTALQIIKIIEAGYRIVISHGYLLFLTNLPFFFI